VAKKDIPKTNRNEGENHAPAKNPEMSSGQALSWKKGLPRDRLFKTMKNNYWKK
jgi:hypothetical protein